ncbi:MAG TPA: hypothetical protein VF348_11975 [Usitatibacter sp.]
MKNKIAAIGLVVFAALALPAWAGGKSAVYGSAGAVGMLAPYLGLIDARSEVSVSVSPLGSGQLVLDVLDGKSVAAVVAMPMPQAIAAARDTAREQGRTLVVPDSLLFHELKELSRGDTPIGFVTLGPAPAGLRKLLAELR